MEERKRERFARSTTTTLGRFKFSTPYFFALTKNPLEAKHLREIAIPDRQFGGSVIRLFDAPLIVGQRQRNRGQITIDDPARFAEESFSNYVKDFPIIIDPSTEYLYYVSNLPNWRKIEKLHPKINQYVQRCLSELKYRTDGGQKWRRGYHWRFWNRDVAENPQLRHELIGSFFDLELEYRSSTLLPPVPIIDSEEDLETAQEINNVAPADAAGKDAEYGNYFILQASAIGKDRIREQLEEYVASSSTRLNVFKFKYLNLRNCSMPELLVAYADFYQRLAEIREQQKQKFFLVLENGMQVFPSAAVAFDGVSTSMTGFELDRRGKAKGLGGLIDYSKKVNVSINTVRKAYRNNGNAPNCNHAVCQPVSPYTATADEWYALRRKHYVLTMDDFMADIARYIHEGNIELARQDLINSYLSPLRELMPTNWGQPPLPVPP